MQTLTEWAQRHNVPPHVYTDLLQTLGLSAPPIVAQAEGASEAGVQSAVRLEAARRGARMFRNNTGVAKGEDGRVIRFGLANESQQVNRVIKSSDLIGITPFRCACGAVYGLFTAYECKRPDWKYRDSDDRARAQLAFIKLVVSLGGIGKFVQSVDDL
jgi:hypothetical protein